MEKIVKFIEAYLDRNTKEYVNVFRVTIEKNYLGPNVVRDIYNMSVDSISLDKEDLEYLYNKYSKQYKEIKQQEIIDIQNKINNL